MSALPPKADIDRSHQDDHLRASRILVRANAEPRERLFDPFIGCPLDIRDEIPKCAAVGYSAKKFSLWKQRSEAYSAVGS
jgi:hypothetical protein